jgi:hypothetical protein
MCQENYAFGVFDLFVQSGWSVFWILHQVRNDEIRSVRSPPAYGWMDIDKIIILFASAIVRYDLRTTKINKCRGLIHQARPDVRGSGKAGSMNRTPTFAN